MSNIVKDGYVIQDSEIYMGEDTDSYSLRIHDMPPKNRPKERLRKYGAKSLTVAELIAIILGVGTTKEDVNQMAHRIIREYGEKALLQESDPKRVAQLLDVPLGKASQIVVSFELGRRFFEHKSGKPVFIRNADQAYRHLKGMGDSSKEQLTGLYLNSRYELIRQEVISIGSVTANIMHPREVFLPAIESSAVAIIIAHNHPSGNTSPTEADIEATEQLCAAGKLLGIELLDHLIITRDSFCSLIVINENGDT